MNEAHFGTTRSTVTGAEDPKTAKDSETTKEVRVNR